MDNIIYQTLLNTGMTDSSAELATYGVTFLTLVILTALATWLVRSKLLNAVVKFIRDNRYSWDDSLIKYHFFQRLSCHNVVMFTTASYELPVVANIFLTRLCWFSISRSPLTYSIPEPCCCKINCFPHGE